MEVKFIENEHKESIKHILNCCFEMPPDMVEGIVSKDFNSEDWLGCFDGDKLAGLIYISSHDMYFYGKTVPMAGIGVVSTLPEYRNRHCASGILIKSLEVLKDRGYVFSALGPFSYSFYRKYGWELGFHTKKYTISMDGLKGIGTGKGEFRPLRPRDIDNIVGVHGNFFSRYNGAVKRDNKRWQSRINGLGKDRTYGYAYSHQGNGLAGYIIYSVKEWTFTILEMAYDSLETKLEILRFVYYHSAQAERVVWEAPQDDNTALILANPPTEQKIRPGMMIRVIDVKAALEAYAYPILYKGSFTIKIDDRWAPWNSRVLRVIIGEGVATVEDAGGDPADLECDIQTFSQIISGYIGMGEAKELGRVTAHNQEILEDTEIIFRKHVTHMTEGF
ncbi:MAG TPA: GNAT family N-acetyltransferase [Clostridia bacterium]|nr:GNAT family N-acetyltransferase [Clostridia bacterium]